MGFVHKMGHHPLFQLKFDDVTVTLPLIVLSSLFLLIYLDIILLQREFFW